jgi:hypothetical protein
MFAALIEKLPNSIFGRADGIVGASHLLTSALFHVPGV